jgi:hypothetical protein
LNANRCGCSYIKLIETGKSRLDIESRTSVLDESSRLFFIYYCHRTEKKRKKKQKKEKFFPCCVFFFLFVPASHHLSALCVDEGEGKKEKNERNSIVKLSAV